MDGIPGLYTGGIPDRQGLGILHTLSRHRARGDFQDGQILLGILPYGGEGDPLPGLDRGPKEQRIPGDFLLWRVEPGQPVGGPLDLMIGKEDVAGGY